ncbi:MAG: glycosyltransferase family 2 protein, partial [Verrucomicrobia bacterium]|nr:glycosyltransferase family 2 protein [Verrucomicrobiota bacterium]
MYPPLVSVLMTVYNREKFLAAAIESVLAQSFTDWELVIVDDQSNDGSLEIARRYAKDRRVRVILNEQNLGDYPNRNCAASLACGKYLKYVDADDLIYPHCLELMVQGMEAFPEAGLGISRVVPGVFAPALFSPADAYRDHFFGSGMFSVGPLDTIVRRDAFEEIGAFNLARHTGDLLCWMRLAQRRPVVAIASGLVWWRAHGQQESVAERRTPGIVAEVAVRRMKIVVETIEDATCPLAELERKIIKSAQLKAYVGMIGGALRRGRFGLARALCRQSGQRLFSFLQASLTHTSAFPRVGLNPVRPPKLVALPAPKSPISAFSFQPSTSTPLVSVLIPAYNAEAHLAEAIESVLDQRFTDWELIIVDDASTDRTAEIAQSCADGNRIRYFRNERNLGKWPNHNRCAELAHGKHLKFLHADDLLYPLCLQVMLQHAASVVKDETLVLCAPSPLPAGTL